MNRDRDHITVDIAEETGGIEISIGWYVTLHGQRYHHQQKPENLVTHTATIWAQNGEVTANQVGQANRMQHSYCQ